MAEKAMAIHSSVLTWRIPGMREPGGLLSMGSNRVGHDWSDLAAAAAAAAGPNGKMVNEMEGAGSTAVSILPLSLFPCYSPYLPLTLKMHILVIASGKRPSVLPCHVPLLQWLCWEQFCFPGHTWQHLEIVLVVANGRWSTAPSI